MKRNRFKVCVTDISGRNEQQFVWLMTEMERIDEVSILSNYNVLFTNRQRIDFGVGCAIAHRKIERMNGLRPGLAESPDQTTGKLCVNEKLHTSAGSTRLIWLSRVANFKAARMSSRSRSS